MKIAKPLKIISGIASIIAATVLSWCLLPPAWFWSGWELIAALIVAIGCIGELILEGKEVDAGIDPEKQRRHVQSMRYIRLVAAGVTAEFCLLGHTIVESQRQNSEISALTTRASQLENDTAHANAESMFAKDRAAVAGEMAAQANERTAIAESNILVLAHEYDLSTNALAEANARLAAVRPIKERLAQFFNAIDPKIISGVRAGTTRFTIHLQEHLFTQLKLLEAELGSNSYIEQVVNLSELRHNISVGTGGSEYDVGVELKPALAQ